MIDSQLFGVKVAPGRNTCDWIVGHVVSLWKVANQLPPSVFYIAKLSRFWIIDVSLFYGMRKIKLVDACQTTYENVCMSISKRPTCGTSTAKRIVSVDSIRHYIGHFEPMLHQFNHPM
jgi:hypothetical protein